jgi:hypothetical protein
MNTKDVCAGGVAAVAMQHAAAHQELTQQWRPSGSGSGAQAGGPWVSTCRHTQMAGRGITEILILENFNMYMERGLRPPVTQPDGAVVYPVCHMSTCLQGRCLVHGGGCGCVQGVDPLIAGCSAVLLIPLTHPPR